MHLLSTNGDCEFPCLWGITPGKTKTDDLKEFVSQFGQVEDAKGFSTSLSWGDNNDSGLYFQIVEDTLGKSFVFEHRGAPEIDYLLFQVDIAHKLGLEKYLAFDYYNLPGILSRYGEPTQVLLGPWPDDPDHPDHWLPFDLVLYYPEKGFLIEYVLERQIDADFFVGCPDQMIGLRVVTWDPQIPRLIDEVVKQKNDFWGINDSNLHTFFLSTVDSMNMTPHDFYETYQRWENTECIRALRSKWPYGYMSTPVP